MRTKDYEKNISLEYSDKKYIATVKVRKKYIPIVVDDMNLIKAIKNRVKGSGVTRFRAYGIIYQRAKAKYNEY